MTETQPRDPKKSKARSPDESIDALLSKLDKDTAVDLETIERTERGAKQTILDFEVAVDSVRRHVTQSVSTMAKSMRFYFWVVLGFWAFGGIGIGYLLYSWSAGVALGFAIFWLLVGSVVLWGIKGTQNTLDEGERMLSRHSSPTDSKFDDKTNATLSLPQELAFTRSLSDTIKGAMANVAGTAALLTPKLKQVVDLRTAKLKQQHFIDTFTFSLTKYNLGLDYNAVQAMLSKKFWAYEDETYWLEESIKEVMNLKIGVSAPVLRLAYYDSQRSEEEVDKTWETIRSSVDLRNAFSLLLIQRKLLDSRSINEASVAPLSELLSGIRRYSLETVNLRATEFFDGLSKYKAEVVSDLASYGLDIKDDLKQLTDFMDLSAAPETWRNQVLDFSAQLLKEDPVVVRLLVRDVEGDQGRIDAWRQVLASHATNSPGSPAKSPDLLERLAVVLSRKRIAKPYDDFADNVYMRHLLLTLESYPDNFSSTRTETQLRLLEDRILRARRNVEAVARRFGVGFADPSFLDEFVPASLTSVEKDFVSEAGSKADVDPRIFEILYFSFSNHQLADQLYARLRGKSRRDSKLGMLVDFLVQKRFVPDGEPKEHLETLFWTQESFNLNDFLQVYYLYERLHRSSDALFDFAAENAILREPHRPDLGEIIAVCPPDASPFESRVARVAKSLVTSEIDSHQLSQSEQEELALAASAVSLKNQGDQGYKQLCVSIAAHRLAPRILYEFADVDRINPNSTLKEAAKRALESNPTDERHFAAFVNQLEMGNLYYRLGNLLEVQIAEATQEIKVLQGNLLGSDQGIQFKEAIKVLFTEQINEEIVKEFLTQQVISAYIITDPKNSPLIRLLDQKDTIAQVQATLAATDSGFRNLVKLKKGSGKATRIGLVPFSMPFEEFSEKFDKVLREAIKAYNPAYPSEQFPDPLPCYLLRIFPSEYGLKEIMSEADAEARPVAIVTELMEESVGGLNEIKLLSLLQSAKTGYEGVKSVIRAIVDHERSSVMTLAGGSIAAPLNAVPDLVQLFEKRKVDKAMLSLYACDRLSDLCVRVAEEPASGTKGAQASFAKNVAERVKELQSIKPSDVEPVLESVYNRLRNIGIGLKV